MMMTSVQKAKVDAGHRYWTPRLTLMAVVMQFCAVGLWWFVVNWMTDIKSEVKDIHSELSAAAVVTADRRIAMAAWKQNTTDRIDGIDNRVSLNTIRLAKVEDQLK